MSHSNIESIVTDLKTSEELYKAGIKLDTALVWMSDKRGYNLWELIHSNLLETDFDKTGRKFIPAPTTDEMILLLPYIIEFKGEKYYFDLFPLKDTKDLWGCRYNSDEPMGKDLAYEMEKSPKQALAKLLLWCKKEGYL